MLVIATGFFNFFELATIVTLPLAISIWKQNWDVNDDHVAIYETKFLANAVSAIGMLSLILAMAVPDQIYLDVLYGRVWIENPLSIMEKAFRIGVLTPVLLLLYLANRFIATSVITLKTSIDTNSLIIDRISSFFEKQYSFNATEINAITFNKIFQGNTIDATIELSKASIDVPLALIESPSVWEHIVNLLLKMHLINPYLTTQSNVPAKYRAGSVWDNGALLIARGRLPDFKLKLGQIDGHNPFRLNISRNSYRSTSQ